MKKIIEILIIFIIYMYQNSISLLLGPCCRFNPSCSNYAIISIKRYGSIRGISLAIKRFLKCHPFHQGGEDPVPNHLN
ncbi:MAG: membrane protein insertion efficiency factor YidD [Thermodesulfobacteriota bacterium]